MKQLKQAQNLANAYLESHNPHFDKDAYIRMPELEKIAEHIAPVILSEGSYTIQCAKFDVESVLEEVDYFVWRTVFKENNLAVTALSVCGNGELLKKVYYKAAIDNIVDYIYEFYVMSEDDLASDVWKELNE